MKKVLVVVMMVGSMAGHGQDSIPQLQAGVYINDSIASIPYCFNATCDSAWDFALYPNANFNPVVSGVYLYCVVTQLNTSPNSAYTSENGILHIIDTLYFSSTNSSYTFHSPDTGSIILKVMIHGIPSIPYQNYPCHFELVETLSNCMNSITIVAQDTKCSVENFNGIIELINHPPAISLNPNPTSVNFTINSQLSILNSQFKLIDISGRVVYQQSIPNTAGKEIIDVSVLSSGMYFYQLTSAAETWQGKVVVEK